VSAAGERRLVLVVGVGRSGTSLFSGILSELGFHIPRPEVKANDTNPRGFGEPRWVVDFHTRMLRAKRVTVNDSRPAAFAKTTAAGDEPGARAELREWLAGEMREADDVLVKDPRTAWFLPLWTGCARELGVPTSFVTMLRHPAEILESARKSYGERQTAASRIAAWINVTLETERSTRGSARAFVRYEDLLADWRREVTRVGELLDVPSLATIEPERAAGVDAFVDPTLHRNRVRWEDVDVPGSLRDMAEAVWRALQPLADPGGDSAETHAALDRCREHYVAFYADAEAIAQSTVLAARPRKKQPAAASDGKPAPWRRRLRRAARALRS
jgi:hypothetical protein